MIGDRPPGHPEIERIVAPNAGPMTLEGTNTYVVAAGDGAFVIDPGPAHEGHIAAVRATVDAHGELDGILLTPGGLQAEACDGRRGVADGVLTAQGTDAHRAAAHQGGPLRCCAAYRCQVVRNEEVTQPQLRVDVGDHAGAAKIDGCRAGRG